MADTLVIQRDIGLREIAQLINSARIRQETAEAKFAEAAAQDVALPADLAGLIPQDDDGRVLTACELVQRRRLLKEAADAKAEAAAKLVAIQQQALQRVVDDVMAEATANPTDPILVAQARTLVKHLSDRDVMTARIATTNAR